MAFLLMNPDGRLEVFQLSKEGNLLHAWQTQAGGSWTGWANLFGDMRSIAGATNGDGRLEVFGVGQDGNLYHIWQTTVNGPWSAWSGLGGPARHISVVKNRDGRIEVFAIGGNSALWHIWQTSANGPWTEWNSLGGDMRSCGAILNNDGRIEVFGVGAADNKLWHIWQTSVNGPWSGWANLNGPANQIGILKNHDGRLEVFTIGGNSALWHIWQTSANGPWTEWNSLGLPSQSATARQIAGARNADGRLEVFLLDFHNVLSHIWQTSVNGPWSSWHPLATDISAIQTAFSGKKISLQLRSTTDHTLFLRQSAASPTGWAAQVQSLSGSAVPTGAFGLDGFDVLAGVAATVVGAVCPECGVVIAGLTVGDQSGSDPGEHEGQLGEQNLPTLDDFPQFGDSVFFGSGDSSGSGSSDGPSGDASGSGGE